MKKIIAIATIILATFTATAFAETWTGTATITKKVDVEKANAERDAINRACEKINIISEEEYNKQQKEEKRKEKEKIKQEKKEQQKADKDKNGQPLFLFGVTKRKNRKKLKRKNVKLKV